MQNKIATEAFKNGFNCAQSIVSAFAPEVGISHELSLKLATGLGGGINRQGGTCGAVVGAYIILGLNFGVDDPGNDAGKARYREIADDFSKKFLKHYNSVKCSELLEADVTNPEIVKELQDKGVYRDFCPKVVNRAAVILESILNEK